MSTKQKSHSNKHEKYKNQNMKTTLFLKSRFICIVREKGKKEQKKPKTKKKPKTAHSSLNIQLIYGNETWQKEENMQF